MLNTECVVFKINHTVSMKLVNTVQTQLSVEIPRKIECLVQYLSFPFFFFKFEVIK